jgi:hypothetical protein
MKRIAFAVIFVLFIANLAAQNLDLPYQPTRRQWLELETYMAIRETTDVWRNQIAIVLRLVDADDSTMMDIVLTSPNGQPGLSRDIQDDYIRTVTSITQAVLNRYEWAMDIEIRVRYF